MDLRVTSDAAGAWLDWGQGRRRCAIGPGGIALKCGEGDGITPCGAFPVREIFYRSDRVAKPEVILPLRAIRPDDGWCDAPDDPNYNRLVALPYPASAEHLWREDHLYDLVAVLGYNDDPVVPGQGSAIFLHLARSVGESWSDQKTTPDYTPTEGCVALAFADALAALGQLRPGDRVVIG
jgi:L,D-peptidoglycan transpeptidase YkuD (ErfK/YbiS/YcfS/YnhG family)